jgi:hypothetical protein
MNYLVQMFRCFFPSDALFDQVSVDARPRGNPQFMIFECREMLGGTARKRL